ncbi:hypothetical protein HPB50_026066 [Hyalomma asiaticum]|uniref:Uncharacterized protein n=1 Tax=Hyalomma asiaticum TaxID=266040 RepID=A0ACB7T385_HYAAI|nr:hypothetical protein HPB50_026066 [Hyalomma asiaticum]
MERLQTKRTVTRVELQKLIDELMQLRTADALELHQEDRIAEMKEELEALAKETKQLDALIEPHVCDEDLAEEYGGVRKNQGLITRVIRNMPLQDNYDVINAKIVNTNSPLALAAKRIAQTGTVIIAFEGYRVLNFVRYGPVLMHCLLYCKEIDVCYACGRLGHRADACRTPGDAICRRCGVASPDEQYVCTPKCKLCGGQHLMASRDCVRSFKIPYIVRRRRREGSKMAGVASPSTQRHPDTADEFQTSSSTVDAQCRRRPAPGATVPPGDVPAPAPGRQNGPIHRDAPLPCLAPAPGRGMAHRGGPGRTPARPPPLRARSSRRSPGPARPEKEVKELGKLRRANEQLRKENAQVKQEMSRLAAEIAAIRRLASSPPSAQPTSAPVAMDASEESHRSSTPKRRAVEKTVKGETGNLLSELKDAFVNM